MNGKNGMNARELTTGRLFARGGPHMIFISRGLTPVISIFLDKSYGYFNRMNNLRQRSFVCHMGNVYYSDT